MQHRIESLNWTKNESIESDSEKLERTDKFRSERNLSLPKSQKESNVENKANFMPRSNTILPKNNKGTKLSEQRNSRWDQPGKENPNLVPLGNEHFNRKPLTESRQPGLHYQANMQSEMNCNPHFAQQPFSNLISQNHFADRLSAINYTNVYNYYYQQYYNYFFYLRNNSFPNYNYMNYVQNVSRNFRKGFFMMTASTLRVLNLVFMSSNIKSFRWNSEICLSHVVFCFICDSPFALFFIVMFYAIFFVLTKVRMFFSFQSAIPSTSTIPIEQRDEHIKNITQEWLTAAENLKVKNFPYYFNSDIN